MGATAVLEMAAATPPARKSFRKLQAWSLMVTAGRTPPPGAALSLSSPDQAQSPRLCPCATRRGRSFRPSARLICPAQPLAREVGTPGPCAPRALAGQVRGPPPPAGPLLCRGQRGRRRFREAGGGPGTVPLLGTFKGRIHVICPASRGNTVSVQHVGRCIYSTRRLSPGPYLDADTGPAASSPPRFSLGPARDPSLAKA